jgi:NTP pyrophosphatase (non-canonical NTP hydrolase)
MGDADVHWLIEFAAAAERTDRFAGSADHSKLLALGLMGEAGSVLTELKKAQRERDAYPAYRQKMLEEIGDFLWYLVRLTSVAAPELVAQFDPLSVAPSTRATLPLFLDLGAAVGEVLTAISNNDARAATTADLLRRIWQVLVEVAREAHVPLKAAAVGNTQKVSSRWPTTGDRVYAPLFDDASPEEEQLPRRLDIEFRERSRGVVVLRCNGINFGDRLTDNIEDPDDYRYHDVFHFSYAVHLGWSPVVRSLLRCKRKSIPKTDEGQDGARAAILEEAVSAIAFSRGKKLGFFDGKTQVDYDVLKTIKEFVEGYEVDRIPLWQWEVAILEGFSIFRQLRANRGGQVILDMPGHKLSYLAPLPKP